MHPTQEPAEDMPPRENLTPAELVQITGKRDAASQASVLARRGIPFVFAGRSVAVDRRVAEAHLALPGDGRRGVDMEAVR